MVVYVWVSDKESGGSRKSRFDPHSPQSHIFLGCSLVVNFDSLVGREFMLTSWE